MAPADCAILLVDDEPAILRLISAVLKAAGFTRISCHTDAASAREAWFNSEPRFDLLITDFSLADGPAQNLVNELLSDRADLPVFLMSGFSPDSCAMPDDLRDSITFIQKPFRPSEIRSAVQDRVRDLPPQT